MSRAILSLSLLIPCLAVSAAEPKKPFTSQAPPVIEPGKLAAVSSFERGVRQLDIASTDKEKEEAITLITAAADAGYPDAQFFVGLVDETPQPAKAREWFIKAANAGHVRAAAKAAVMLEEGRGGDSNKELALKYHRIAAEGGIAESAFKVAKAKELSGGANTDEMLKMYQRAAMAGDSEANLRLGDLYFTGDAGVKNQVEAFKYYRNAAQLKSAKAYFKMGYCYERGHGVAANNQEAARWYEKGADAGDLNCIANLARFYETGAGVDKDPAKAAKLYRTAAEQGEPFAQLSLGSMYRSGTGVKPDLVEAYRWIGLAAERGYGEAILKLLEKDMSPEQVAQAKERMALPLSQK
jgi:TPR repeat protein